MCKKHPKCTKALSYYRKRLKKRFPEARIEVMPEALGGFDDWVELSVSSADLFDAIEYVSQIENEITDRFDVDIVTTTGEFEETVA
jgi:hypothetical protein